MSMLSLIFSFIFIFGIFALSYKQREAVFTNLRLAFVKSSLVISFLAVIFIETLSHFEILTQNNIQKLWFLALLSSFVILILSFKKNRHSFDVLNFGKLIWTKNGNLTIKLILLLILITLLALFVIAFTPNSNWDSYTYHLPRVEHWIQDKNVDFFATNDTRQLYLAPFAEYFILNLRLLSGNAVFVNFVQFFSMINCLLLASLIAKYFRLNYKWQLVAIVLVLTLPMGLLQSTTTQTDLVVSFFLISFVYFGLSLMREKKFSWGDISFLSLSFSLGILTKSTFYIFALPFCLMFGIYFVKLFKLRSLYILLLVISVFSMLNFPFLARNFQQFGSPLGPQKTAPYYLASLNEDFGIKETLSNIVKNAGLHLALPSDSYNEKIVKIVVRFHDIIGFPLNSVTTSWFGMKYAISLQLNSDTVGNFFHIILFFIALAVILIKLKLTDKLVLFYSAAIVLGFVLFAFLLKWQPWQTRLDLPMFILIAPLIAYALSILRWKYVSDFICVFLLCVAIGIVFIFDPAKPVFGANSFLKKDSNSYIVNYDVVKKVESKLKKNKISNVGLVLGGDSPEWQYWLLSKNRRFEYSYFHKDFIKTPNFDANFRYRALIIDNVYLKEPMLDSQINEFIRNKEDISEILDVDDKVSLVIYKTEQNAIITYN